MALAGLINTMPTRVLAWVCFFSACWQVVGALVLVFLLPGVAPTHQTASFVFGDFQGVSLATSGLPTNAYIFFAGMLMGAFTCALPSPGCLGPLLCSLYEHNLTKSYL
jgi:hypothetical protein